MRPRKKTFVTSFIKNASQKRRRIIQIANKERLHVIKQLASMGKKVIVVVPKEASNTNLFVQEANKLGRTVRVLRINKNSPFENNWQRDAFTRLDKRFYNKDFSIDLGARVKPELQRYFGEGGRVINLGKINGKPTLIISNSLKETFTRQTPQLIREEFEMLRRRGYNVFELPGHWFSPYGQKGKASLKREKFDHLDTFINSIPEKKLMLVDPDYLKSNEKSIRSISNQIGFKIIIVPEKEKYFYPANLLQLGKGEVIINSQAKQTIELLRKNGVKVFVTPKGIKANLTMRGSVGCFVNVD